MTDVAMVFGTDDHDAVQACVTAAARGGHCTFPAGQSFVISSAGQNVTVPPGATIDGSGTIYYAPQGTITAMINDTLFGVNEEGGTNISYPYRIAAPPEISTRPSDIVTGCTQSSKARSPSSGPRQYKMRPGFLVLGIVDAAAAAMGARIFSLNTARTGARDLLGTMFLSPNAAAAGAGFYFAFRR